jgi:hypothetical protein
MSSLVENSPCINLVKTSLLTVLQSILDTESAFCTQLQTLNIQITNLQNQVNNSPVNKVINVTACNGVTVNETPTSKTFQLGAFVPKKTILPYFGNISDFFSSGPQAGLGKPSAGLSGWAIADGRNGTINACGRYLKYDCAGCCTTGGSNNVTLGVNNIPTLSFDVDAEFTLNFTGETDIDGEHTHKLRTDRSAADNCNPAIPNSCNNGTPPCRDAVDTSGADTQVDTSVYMGSSGCHSHTFTVDSTVTGTFTGSFLNPNPFNIPTPVNIEPSYIAGIPIQFLGC